jgi:heparosan-N-sulfate-glucuronate 5-epimerase
MSDQSDDGGVFGDPAAQRSPHSGPGNPGRLSSSRNFAPGIGEHIHEAALGGYYIDFRIKTETPDWPPPWMRHDQPQIHVAVAQWGLGCYERFLDGEGESWLNAASLAADYMVNDQVDGGPLDGAWLQHEAMPHTYRIDPGWASAMGQGEGASLLVRVHKETGDDRYSEAALRALRLLSVPVADGGLRAPLGDGFFLEEYPTETPSFVLNGGIFALWGCHDVALALDDAEARTTFDVGVATLAANLKRWDLGNWSRYDLYPFPVVNISSSAYHLLHTTQLRAMALVAPNPEFTQVADRFEGYTRSRFNRTLAFARKVAFRLVIPRNRLLAQRVPWGPRGTAH